MKRELQAVLSLAMVVAMVFTALPLGSFAAENDDTDTYIPLTVLSGFNVDVIAEAYPATASTTAPVDVAGTENTWNNYSFYSKNYVEEYNTAKSAEIDDDGGLPDHGLVETDNDSLNAGVTYQLGDYTEFNALKLTTFGSGSITTGTLEFDNAGRYNQISILGTGGSGASTVSAKVKYTDDSESSPETFICLDWYSQPGFIMSYMGRVYRGPVTQGNKINVPDPHETGETHGPNLYGFEIETDPAKNIKSITFTQTNRDNNDAAAVIMAVSGVIYSGEADPNASVSTPTISPNGGSFATSQTVTITCATEDATIFYTTDGSDPTPVVSVIAPISDASPTEYTGPFTVTETTTVKAIAVKDEMPNSAVSSAVFTKTAPDGISVIDVILNGREFSTTASVGESPYYQVFKYTVPQGKGGYYTFFSEYINDVRIDSVGYLCTESQYAALCGEIQSKQGSGNYSISSPCLIRNDDGGSGYNFYINYNLAENTTYYFVGTRYSTSYTGNYKLNFMLDIDVTLNNQGANQAGTQTLYSKGDLWYANSNRTGSPISRITLPQKDGYAFDGYYTQANGAGTKLVEANGTIASGLAALETNTTLYANWTVASDYTIDVSANPTVGGSVTGDGTFANGTSQTVTATPNSGYSFINWMENGSVVSTNASYTFNLTQNRDLVANFLLDAGEVEIGADPIGNAPAPSLPNQDTVRDAVLTEQDYKDINGGSTITIGLEVEETTPPPADQTAIENKLATNQTVGMYLDISMFKQKDNGQPQAVTELNAPIQIEFDVPDDLRAPSGMRRAFSVIRVHGGTATTLPNESSNANKIRFSTDRFSTYALVYTDTAISTTTTSSSSGGSSSYTPAPNPWLEPNPAQSLASGANKAQQDSVRTKSNATYGVRKASWQKLKDYRYYHDIMENNAVQVRLYIDNPAAMTRDMYVTGFVKGSFVESSKAKFEKWFTNKIRVVHMDEAGAWGQEVRIAAKVDLAGMDTNKLYFYSYDKKANKYTRITAPKYRIDTNGYLHFYTELAGDIVISDGALEKK